MDPKRFQAETNEACSAAQDACGVVFETEKNSFVADRMIDAQRQSFKGKIYFRDFYGTKGDLTISVKLDVTEFDRLFLPTVVRPLLHPYSDASVCQIGIACVSLEELLANKLKCLLQRRHSFDLYDLVYATFLERSIARSCSARSCARRYSNEAPAQRSGFCWDCRWRPLAASGTILSDA
ncbi:nucleotidyl transferase AbiEii/AbiGii toxin family protein [Sphingopyxis sp. 550A]